MDTENIWSLWFVPLTGENNECHRPVSCFQCDGSCGCLGMTARDKEVAYVDHCSMDGDYKREI